MTHESNHAMTRWGATATLCVTSLLCLSPVSHAQTALEAARAEAAQGCSVLDGGRLDCYDQIYRLDNPAVCALVSDLQNRLACYDEIFRASSSASASLPPVPPAPPALPVPPPASEVASAPPVEPSTIARLDSAPPPPPPQDEGILRIAPDVARMLDDLLSPDEPTDSGRSDSELSSSAPSDGESDSLGSSAGWIAFVLNEDADSGAPPSFDGVGLSVRATEPHLNSRGETVYPELTLECRESARETSVQIYFAGENMTAFNDGGMVAYRVDGGEESDQEFLESKDTLKLGLWYEGASVPFIKRLMDAETLSVRAAPASAESVEATFQVAGLERAVRPLREACGW